MCDDVHVLMRHQITVEYETVITTSDKDTNSGDGLRLELPLLAAEPQDFSDRTTTVRKKILLSKQEGARARVNETIRLFVLPEYPCSGFSKEQVDFIVLRRQRLLVSMKFSLLWFFAFFVKYVLDVQSLVHQKNQGWLVIFFNVLWTPFGARFIAQFVERKRLQRWLHDGEIVANNKRNTVQIL